MKGTNTDPSLNDLSHQRKEEKWDIYMDERGRSLSLGRVKRCGDVTQRRGDLVPAKVQKRERRNTDMEDPPPPHGQAAVLFPQNIFHSLISGGVQTQSSVKGASLHIWPPKFRSILMGKKE